MFRRHNCIISQINTVLTPNNLPVTNFPIAVVDVTVYQICLSGEDGYLASWLCGIENLSGKLGSLHVRVTPPERSVTVMVNGREYEAAAHNLTAISYNDVTPNVTFSHDRFGRVTSAVTAGVSSNLYTYSHTGLLTNEISCGQSSVSALTRSYDPLGRPAGLTLGPDYTVTYGYDEHGRLGAVSNVAFHTTYSYYPGGSSAGWTTTLTNGIIVSFMTPRDPYRGLVMAVSNTVNGALVSEYLYNHDALGRVVSRNADAFGYNSCSELTSATIGSNVCRYAYDGIGNLLWTTNNGIGTAYYTNPLNQYTNILRASASPRELEYDLDDNLLNLPSPSGRGGGGEGWLCQWDGENRLIAVYNDNALVISNAYDHQSRRVLKVTPRETRTFLYDGWDLVQETIATATSTTTNHYVWGKDLSGTLQGAGGVGGLLAVCVDNSCYFPLYDNNGNITAYVAEGGIVVAEYIYDAFGNTISQSGSMADTFPHRFSTKYYDAETGFYYYGYRFYSPALMRWLNRDPIEENGGMNLYVFILNNPVNVIDHNGHVPVTWGPSFPDPDKCGQDITIALLETLNSLEDQFKKWSQFKKCARCIGCLSPWGWDIVELRELGKSGEPLLPWKHKGTGELSKTVTFQGKCHYGSAANYAMYGKIMRLCDDQFGLINPSWRRSNVLGRLALWKTLMYKGAQLKAATAFTLYGFDKVNPRWGEVRTIEGKTVAPSSHQAQLSILRLPFAINWSPTGLGD